MVETSRDVDSVSSETRAAMRADPARRPPHNVAFIRDVPFGMGRVRLQELLTSYDGIEKFGISNKFIKKSKGRTNAHITFFGQFLACDAVRRTIDVPECFRKQEIVLILRPIFVSRLPYSVLTVEAPAIEPEPFEAALRKLALPGLEEIAMVYKGVVNLHFDTTASAKDAARRIYESRTSARLPSETLAYYADQLRPPNRIFSVEALSMKPERLEATLRTLDLSAVKGFDMQNGVATFIFHDSSSRGSFADQVRKLIESAQLPHETRLDTETIWYTAEEDRERHDKEYLREVNKTKYQGIGMPTFDRHPGHPYIIRRTY